MPLNKYASFSAAALLLVATACGQNYKSYNQLLSKYATADGVRYQAWAANDVDHTILDATLADWSKIDATKLGKNDKAAFRINLYNASMISVALDKYPLKSVTKIGIPFSVFKRRFIETPNGKISLDTLEKKLLLKDFPDARIHFAVNCASVSCPPLRNEAFTGKKLEKQLQQQAERFVASKHAVQISGDTAHYSSLFNWYQKDFGESNPAHIINQFSEKKISTSLKVKWIKYDWNLNEAK